jgi:hypothetical protein
MTQNLKARGVEGALGRATNGSPQVAVLFQITEGERAGENMTWYGYFTEKTQETTIKALRACGWQGDNLADLSGLDANEVTLVTEMEEYEGALREKVRWVNSGSGLALKARMDPQEASAFAASMRGFIISQKPASPAPPGSGTRPMPKAPPPPARSNPPQARTAPPVAQQATGTGGYDDFSGGEDEIPF